MPFTCRSARDHIMWIDAVLDRTTDTWEWRDNNERVVWENWYYASPDFRSDNINYINLHLRQDKTFLNNQLPKMVTSIYCEKEYGMYLFLAHTLYYIQPAPSGPGYRGRYRILKKWGEA